MMSIKFDFTAGVLNPAILKELGLNQRNEGLKVNLKNELDISKLKPKTNNHNVARNRSIVRNYLSCLEESGSISKVDFMPLVVSPVNLVPKSKSNGAPQLIHDLDHSRFNKFVSCGPKVKDLNVFNLSKNFSNNTYMTDIFVFLFFHPIGRILDLVLNSSILFSMFFGLGSLLPLTIFRIL